MINLWEALRVVSCDIQCICLHNPLTNTKFTNFLQCSHHLCCWKSSQSQHLLLSHGLCFYLDVKTDEGDRAVRHAQCPGIITRPCNCRPAQKLLLVCGPLRRMDGPHRHRTVGRKIIEASLPIWISTHSLSQLQKGVRNDDWLSLKRNLLSKNRRRVGRTATGGAVPEYHEL